MWFYKGNSQNIQKGNIYDINKVITQNSWYASVTEKTIFLWSTERCVQSSLLSHENQSMRIFHLWLKCYLPKLRSAPLSFEQSNKTSDEDIAQARGNVLSMNMFGQFIDQKIVISSENNCYLQPLSDCQERIRVSWIYKWLGC